MLQHAPARKRTAALRSRFAPHRPVFDGFRFLAHRALSCWTTCHGSSAGTTGLASCPRPCFLLLTETNQAPDVRRTGALPAQFPQARRLRRFRELVALAIAQQPMVVIGWRRHA